MTHLTRRLLLLGAAAWPMARSGSAHAQQFPSKPIRLVVPNSVGTSADATARYFGDALSKQWNVPVVVENRSGAGGLLAYTSVAKAPADGYTLLMAGLPLQLLPLMAEVPNAFDPVKDFTHIGRVARAPLGIVVPVDSPYRTLGDLLQALKTSPQPVTYATGGVGTAGHMCVVMLNSVGNTRATHVPFKDISAAVTDVAAGRVGFTCQGSTSVLPMIQGGRLRPLAVTGLARWEALPNVPTAAESGMQGVEVWPGLDFISSAGVPDDVVQRLSDALMQIGQTAEYKAFSQKLGMSHVLMNHRELKEALPKEFATWRRMAAIARSS